jgi:hypothetical protein
MAWLTAGTSSRDSKLSFRALDPISVRLCGHLPRECFYLQEAKVALHYASMLCLNAWNSTQKLFRNFKFPVRALRYFQNDFPTFILSLFYFVVVVKINTAFKGDHISQLELLRNKEMGSCGRNLICFLRDCEGDCRDN